jgi:hypothetical protein
MRAETPTADVRYRMAGRRGHLPHPSARRTSRPAGQEPGRGAPAAASSPGKSTQRHIRPLRQRAQGLRHPKPAAAKAKPARKAGNGACLGFSEHCLRLRGRLNGRSALSSHRHHAGFSPYPSWPADGVAIRASMLAGFGVIPTPEPQLASPLFRRVIVHLDEETLCELSSSGQTFLQQPRKMCICRE